MTGQTNLAQRTPDTNHNPQGNNRPDLHRPGGWLRKVVRTRIFNNDSTATTRTNLQARQWGTGVSCGSEAVAMAHLPVHIVYTEDQHLLPSPKQTNTTASEGEKALEYAMLYRNTTLP